MDQLKYCRVCLITDVKMFYLDTSSNDSIGVVYSHLSQIPIYNGNQHVCFECAGLLLKFQNFKSKCLRAHNILSRINVDLSQITKQAIKKIDRKFNKLESNLILSPVSYCCDDPSDVKTNINITSVILKEGIRHNDMDIDVKVEKLSEEDIDKNYDSTEPLNEFNDIKSDTSEGYTPEKIEKQKKLKQIKTIKAKKRIIKTIDTSKDDLSDDEPLSKRATKKVKPASKKNGTFVSYFEDFATISFLTPEEARKEVLLRKDTANYKNSPFKCNYCYRGYEAKLAFENHMKRHSLDYGKFECELCQLRFPQQVYLCKHKLSCHKRKFSCKLCPYVCYCTNQAKTHVKLHKGLKYPCKDCGEIFSMPNSLLMHKRVKHLQESVRECVCEHCGSTFGTPRGLFLHGMKVHRQDVNEKLGPQCDDCGVHFSSEEAWKRHLVLSSKHTVSNGCKACGETFSNIDDLKEHSKVHSRKFINRYDIKVPAACVICDTWLSNRMEYKSHFTTEHPQTVEAKRFNADEETPFVCEVCGQMFKKQCFLTYHQRKHTGERPYSCQQCGKTFQLAGALSVHRGVHARLRAHKCDMCGRVFTFKSALNKHIKAHLGIRPHKCAICDKGFIHKCDLKLHIKYVHDKVPWPKKKKRNDEEPYLAEFNKIAE